MNKYESEVKKKWGNTPAYEQSAESLAGKSEVEIAGLAEGMMDIFHRLGEIKEEKPSSESAQGLVGELKEYITGNLYTCTDEILAGLGKMYVGDERFKENIDRAGGKGTAAFAAEAISIYCSK